MNGLQESQKSESALNVSQPIGTKKNENEIPYGYCHCGCGQKTELAKQTDARKGHIKGKPLYFINYHHSNGKGTELNYNWKGGKSIRKGRIVIRAIDHPRNNSSYVMEHIIIAEKALGKYLPKQAVVHHIDENKLNNKKDNLIICEDNNYHLLLHSRARAYKTCGHATWKRCGYCKKYDTPNSLKKSGSHWYHKAQQGCRSKT